MQTIKAAVNDSTGGAVFVYLGRVRKAWGGGKVTLTAGKITRMREPLQPNSFARPVAGPSVKSVPLRRPTEN